MAVNNNNNNNSNNHNCNTTAKPATGVHNSRRRHASLTPVTSVTAAAASNATNRRYSLDQTNASSTVYCEGYARIKRRNVLTWTTRFLVLTHTNLLLFHNKQDATYRRNVVESLLLKSGRVSPKNDLTIEFTLADGREVLGRVFSRADQFQWITAFYQLAMTSEVVRRPKSASMDAQDPKKRHVSFFGSVKVRTIPTLPDDQVLELFYSKQDVEKFSAQATSLRTRTGDAVSLVFHKPLLAWRRQLV
uniref:PH domain-containing protein n=1 Tax=Peronospora matthiolae TaxID=2874970 RepID=A0AAV1URY7_9STRA